MTNKQIILKALKQGYVYQLKDIATNEPLPTPKKVAVDACLLSPNISMVCNDDDEFYTDEYNDVWKL